MPLFAIPFPAINPIAVSLGPFAILWYALAYIVGLIIGWRYCLILADRPPRLIPRKEIEYRGGTFTEMDVDAVLRRAPVVALVDELAHTNVPGSRNVGV